MKTEWKARVFLTFLYDMYDRGDIKLRSLAKCTANRLRVLPFYSAGNPEFVDIVCEFEDIAGDDLRDLDDYHEAMDMLYDFGDQDNQLWIETSVSEIESNEQERKFKELIKNVDEQIKISGMKPEDISPSMMTYLLKSPVEYRPKMLKRWKEHSVRDVAVMPNATNQASLIEID